MARMNKRPLTPEQQEFEQRLVEVARVTRVMAGGKRMRFRATLAIGDKKGRVGVGIAKGADVTAAIQKAFNQAKKAIIFVPILKGTLPHEVRTKFGGASIMIKPAKSGAGVKAGGATRIILELAGVQDVTAKSIGSPNKINSIRATLKALDSFKRTPEVKKAIDRVATAKRQTTAYSGEQDQRGRGDRRRPSSGGARRQRPNAEMRAASEKQTDEPTEPIEGAADNVAK